MRREEISRRDQFGKAKAILRIPILVKPLQSTSGYFFPCGILAVMPVGATYIDATDVANALPPLCVFGSVAFHLEALLQMILLNTLVEALSVVGTSRR
jgi:hypothetical protein